MSILVFGGAGFVGSYLVRKLLEEGEDVVALDVAMPDPPPPALRDVLKKIKFEYCHGEYAAEVIKMVTKHKAHAVVNLVTSSSSDLELNPQRAVRINLETQINILEAAKTFGLKRVVFSSSGHVYGAGRSEAVHEESLLKPDTLYGACKTMNEYLGAHYQKHFGVDYVALRLCLIFGWEERKENPSLTEGRGSLNFSRILRGAYRQRFPLPERSFRWFTSKTWSPPSFWR